MLLHLVVFLRTTTVNNLFPLLDIGRSAFSLIFTYQTFSFPLPDREWHINYLRKIKYLTGDVSYGISKT